MYRQIVLTGLALLLLTSLSPVVRGQNPAPEMNTSSAVPVISIETSVPGEINIGASAHFVISVKNSGKSIAEGVSIQTTLPPTVKFVEADPNPSLAKDRLLQFEVGDLAPGTVRRISIELIPQKTGPVDLQAKAFFSASTQSALQVRRPEITIQCGGPETAQIGETVTFRVVVQNIGDGPAQQVVLTPQLPESSYLESQVPHAAKIPVLAAGQAQEFKFVVRANQRELLEGNFIASAQGNREVQCSHRVKILCPDLRVEVTGTHIGFLGTEGEYALRTWNPGDTVLRGVRVALQVADGLEVTTLSEEASVDRENRIYTWCLPSLNPGDSHSIQLKAKAAKVGRQVQQVVAMTDAQLRAQGSHLTHVISRANVELAVSNAKEAIEVNAVEEFTISVVNHGSRAAETVTVTVQLPEGVQPVATDGSMTADRQVHFPGFRLKPAESKTLTFRAVGLSAGDHAVRATVETDFAAVPMIAETLVYFYDADELQRIARELDATVLVR
jgi:uncharacterized repeat protein (TIGR01451 family)